MAELPIQEVKMSCVFCGGKIEPQNTTFVYEDKKQYIVIENVPAEVCIRCGEKTYSPDVADDVLKFAKTIFKPIKTIQIPVFDYVSRIEAQGNYL